MAMGLDSPFWRQDCRGAGLSHTHHHHVGDDPYKHDQCPCRDCGLTPARVRVLMASDDDAPLDLPQPDGDCGYVHASRVSRTSDGLGWASCPGCQKPLEAKMATGQLAGPLWGAGRGWVSPRLRKKLEAVAYRAMKDREGLA